MSTNQKAILALFAQLERDRYYGLVEVSLAAGQLKFVRKIESLQDYEIIAANWDAFSPEIQLEFREKFKGNEKFLALLREAGSK